ncbi:MAG TPA: hypothetical protein VF243_08505, partial [Nitrosospira sp.]
MNQCSHGMNPHFAMSLAEYFTYPYPARTGISVLLPALIFFVLGGGVVEAHEVQPSEAKNNSPPVIISAPESLRNLLKTHFQLPAEPVVDDIARATFMRRARQEIGELLATEGYFTPTLTLQSTPDETPVLEVAPGPRALITEVRIESKGDLAVDAPERRARIE